MYMWSCESMHYTGHRCAPPHTRVTTAAKAKIPPPTTYAVRSQAQPASVVARLAARQAGRYTPPLYVLYIHRVQSEVRCSTRRSQDAHVQRSQPRCRTVLSEVFTFQTSVLYCTQVTLTAHRSQLLCTVPEYRLRYCTVYE